ncbi:NADP-dependent oxidoreductase [Lactiplantibacillus sp. WILCCON 0030]|uniref:NADP-dependent oxidoreductase n=1 Tax=Lactiplantibacillus brownii TaxID=3069269 RepID=A0ABU1A6Y0_9LACO|nr:NADP-dependent oxidoreductase [Lactiplantibacillus brownii]MDQ7936709.1 NADP-dependent oxidoreductase [Lactiplantibacillus brownii]
MQAAQLTHYQSDFKLAIRDIPTPTPSENEVLVQVKVAAVNPLEHLIGSGSVKLIQNYAMPLTMGNELAGIITAVGSAVSQFKVGDEVYARLPLTKIGAFAEYVVIDEQALALKPKHLDFAHSAAVPLTGLTAYQGFTEELAAQPGQSVMIPGGSGSFGQLAIPIAKALELTVMVSGNARGQKSATAMGVAQYFNYKEENYWETLAPVDYVIDTIGKSEFAHELSVLKSGGRLLSLRMGPNRRFAQQHQLSFLKTTLFSMAGAQLDRQAKKAGVQYHFIFVRSDGAQLAKITEIVERENIVPAIDPTEFSLAQVNEALDLVANGHPKGKVLIRF